MRPRKLCVVEPEGTFRSWAPLCLCASVAFRCCFGVAPVAAQEPEPLEDNSFLIEEAYNQAPGVVQEISNFVRASGGSDWIYTLTQEWPLGGVRHQLSYTIPLEHHGDLETTGLGDVLLNYRFQAAGADGGWVYLAPRLSAVLPTGRARSGRGSGSLGVQVNLPVTLALSPRFSTHWNAGATLLPSAENLLGDRATAASFNAGASAIWLVRPLFNLMLEAVWLRESDVVGRGATERASSAFLNPGFRWGFNCRGGLQIVTGLAYTVSLTDRDPDALFLYLSFEHPFRRLSPQ